MQRNGRAKGRGKDGCKREIENEAHSDSWKESVRNQQTKGISKFMDRNESDWIDS